MKALNIVGLVVSIGTLLLTFVYLNEVNNVRFFSRYQDMFGPSRSVADVTFEAGLWMFACSSFFIFQAIRNLVKIKTATTKTLAIVTLSLIGIAAIWNLLLLSSPTHISFDEGGQVWLIGGLMMLAFSIVFLVQAIKYTTVVVNDEILDEEII